MGIWSRFGPGCSTWAPRGVCGRRCKREVPEEWTKAVFSYNPDKAYVNAVWQAANKAGTDAAA